jgi:choline dehydrogenase-like flavoprotein
VGGNTKFYGAALFRLRQRDFGELAHDGGISPGWPISYDDLELYYTKAEHLYHVHGERGVDPTEPWTSSPYRFPAVPHEPRIQQLHDDLARCGLRPFHVPLGIMLDQSKPGTSRCIRCETCDGFPCLVQGKSDAHVVCVDPALEHPNVSLMTNARVTRLLTSPSGRRVTGVEVEYGSGKTNEVFGADVVVSSCGAINSAALLLRSANDRHPNGLANSSDMVGRHYMGHVNSVLLAISKTPNPTVFQKTLALNDFYFGDPDFPYPMGHVSFEGKLDAVALSAGAPPFVPGMTLDVIARHSLDFWLTSEDLPDPDNRVTLDRDGNIVLSYTPNNDAGHKRLIRKLEGLLQRLDMHPHLVPRNLFVGNRIPLAGVAHQNGTIRFGRDPKTSALDINCKAHDLDNLYVVDGSFFPSSGAVNPALTIMANALRVGDHLLERLGARAAAPVEAAV